VTALTNEWRGEGKGTVFAIVYRRLAQAKKVRARKMIRELRSLGYRVEPPGTETRTGPSHPP
jgi:hypothetical protein